MEEKSPTQALALTVAMEFAQPANATAIRTLEQFTSTPGAALGALKDVGLVVVAVRSLFDLLSERDELLAAQDNPVIGIGDTRAIVTGPVLLAPNLHAWLDAAGNVAELEVIR